MNARFRIGFLQILYFVPGIRRCCCVNAYARDRSTSLRTGIALTGKHIYELIQTLLQNYAPKHFRKLENRFYSNMSSSNEEIL